MKRKTIAKLITLILAVVVAATVLTGCIVNYNEDEDLSQVILEVNPVEIKYIVPMKGDYLDLDGNKVKNPNNEPGFETDAEGNVQAVLYDHAGNPIGKPMLENGAIKYEQGSDAVSGEYAVLYAVENGAVTGATEYRYTGVINVGGTKLAQWVNVSDHSEEKGKTVYGKLSGVTYGSDAPATLDGLPEIKLDEDADGNFSWEYRAPIFEKATFTSEKESFYKVTLINYFNNYAADIIKDRGYDVDEAFEYFIRNFYSGSLSRAEQDAATLAGNVVFGVTEQNRVRRAVYDSIDKRLAIIYQDIADDFGQTVPSVGESTDDKTTYPVPGDEEKDEAYEKEYKVWSVTDEPERCVGTSLSGNFNSMQREGVRRFVDYIERSVKDNYAMSEEERAHYNDEIAEMYKKCATVSGVDELYTKFSEYDVVHMLYGNNTEYTIKQDGFKAYLGRSRNITSDVASVYAEELAKQVRAASENIENYYTAATGDDTVLYFADNEYFWVKHILIPFSDDQKSALEKYKAKNSDAATEAYREQLGKQVRVYKHKNGEDDTSRAYTIDEAWADISGAILAVSSNAYAAARKFDELIYTYNTDPGIFDNEMGYAVTATPESEGGKEESYMIEFAKESRALYNAYRRNQSLLEYKQDSAVYGVSKYDEILTSEVEIGSISAPVLTDYGWHIIYLNYVPVAGTQRALNEYLTAGRYSTVAESIGDDISSRIDAAYVSWQSSVASKYSKIDGVIVSYKDRFAKRLEDYAKAYYNNDTEEEEEES